MGRHDGPEDRSTNEIGEEECNAMDPWLQFDAWGPNIRIEVKLEEDTAIYYARSPNQPPAPERDFTIRAQSKNQANVVAVCLKRAGFMDEGEIAEAVRRAYPGVERIEDVPDGGAKMAAEFDRLWSPLTDEVVAKCLRGEEHLAKDDGR
jgi:hypothetical protein